MRSMSRIISCCSIVYLALALAPPVSLAQTPATAKNHPSQALSAAAQNPSPMVEHTRAHPRLTQQSPPGDRYPLPLGTLFVPQGLHRDRPATLLFFFHGGDWLPELAASQQHQMAVVRVQAGAGSGSYVQLFLDPKRFLSLISAAESASHTHFSQIALGGWSAGCGAIRQILLDPASYDRVNRVLCIDGVHTGYTNGMPGPLESDLDASNLQAWLRFGRDALAGKKRLIITHSEIFPGTFASTRKPPLAVKQWQLSAPRWRDWSHGHANAEPVKRRRPYRNWFSWKLSARSRRPVAFASQLSALAAAEQIRRADVH